MIRRTQPTSCGTFRPWASSLRSTPSIWRASPTIRPRSRRLIINRYASPLLWLALAVQAGWVVVNGFVLHRSPGLGVLGVVLLAAFTAFAAGHRHHRWRGLSVVVRVLVGAYLLVSVGDRFGVLGRPGDPGVTWGNFSHFIEYTRSVVSFLPGGLAPTLATLATVAEITLGSALILGVRMRLTALAAAFLMAVYGVAMTISLPPEEQFHYNVFVVGAAVLVLATLGRYPLTIDALLNRIMWRHAHTPLGEETSAT